MAIINKQKKSKLQNTTYSMSIYILANTQTHTHTYTPERIFGAFIFLIICVFWISTIHIYRQIDRYKYRYTALKIVSGYNKNKDFNSKDAIGRWHFKRKYWRQLKLTRNYLKQTVSTRIPQLNLKIQQINNLSTCFLNSSKDDRKLVPFLEAYEESKFIMHNTCLRA